MATADLEDKHKQITQISKSLISGDNRKIQAKEIIGTECSWELYILPIPRSVAILGQLLALGTKQDFSLEEKIPEGGFKHIKHPSSFRACLVQLALEGSDAFSLSHKNMDKIMLYVQQFQLAVKDLVPLLLNKDETNPDLINSYLSDLDNYTNKCVKLGETTCATFRSTINLLSEIQEISTTAKGLHENKLKEISQQRQVAEQQEEINKQLKVDMDSEKRKLEEQIEKAKEHLEKKEEEIPGVAASLAINAWNCLLSTASVAATVTSLTRISKPVAIAVTAGYVGVQAMKYITGKKTKCADKSEALQNVTNIDATTKHFSATVNDIKDSIKVPGDNEGQCERKWEKELADVTAEYTTIMNHLQKFASKSIHTGRAIDICKCGVRLCEDIQERHGKVSKEIEDSLDKIKEEAEDMKLALEGSSMTNLMSPTTEKGTVQEASEGVYKKVQMAKEELDYLRNVQQAKLAKAEEMEKQQQIFLENLVKMDITEIDFEQIVYILSECLQAFGQIQEQWRNLETFLCQMSNRIKVCLHEDSKRFSRRVKYNGKVQTLDSCQIILELAASANAIAHSIEIIAKVYTDVTGKYVVGPMAGLTAIVGLDPDKDEKLLTEKREELNKQAIMANEEIKKLANESRSKHLKEIDDQFKRIDALGEQLPGIPNERKAAIRDKIREISNESKPDLDTKDFI